MTDIIALIDGDILAYKAACVNQEDIDLGDGIVNSSSDPKKARSDVEDLVNSISTGLFADRTIVCLTGPMNGISARNFRKDLYRDYKGNRNKPKPVLLPTVKEHIRSTFETKIKDGLEADDVLGILLTHPTLIPGKRILVSTDKDLLQVPGRHFNPVHNAKRMISEAAGNRWFFTQALTGDPTDNYPGCRGIGPKKAKALLDDTKPADWWKAIVATYEKAGLTKDDALVQARCARILQHTDYNFKRKEVILWTP